MNKKVITLSLFVNMDLEGIVCSAVCAVFCIYEQPGRKINSQINILQTQTTD